MNALISAKEQEISNVTSDIKNKEAAIAEYEADIAAQNLHKLRLVVAKTAG